MSNKQDHKRWRKEFNEKCRARDKNKCVFCHATESLDVHHITDMNLMPNGGYAPSNGITVCQKHHRDCEQFHIVGRSSEGYSPEDLYKKIGSSNEKAYLDCLSLK